jgi:hypothetical protein
MLSGAVIASYQNAYKGRPCTMLLSMATWTAFFNSFLLGGELAVGVVMGLI